MLRIEKLFNNLSNLRLHNGLFIASTGAHYQKVWIRDTFYEALPYLATEPEKFVQSIQSLLDYYIHVELKHHKLHWLIAEPSNKAGYRYTHPRMTPDLNEIEEEWGFKQNDCLGELLYGIYLGESMGYKIIRNENDKYIINLIIKALGAIEYWKDPDNGIWEEHEEVHASSIGAVVAGLKGISSIGFEVPIWLIIKGEQALEDLLPRESVTKECDLALMTLIYPFNVVQATMAQQILTNVEEKLLRARGVIRYKGDVYYNPSKLEGNEAEWCFGIAYLALSYNSIGENDKARHYLNILLDSCVSEDGKVPELFYGGTGIPNDNNPLGWSIAMTIIALRIIK